MFLSDYENVWLWFSVNRYIGRSLVVTKQAWFISVVDLFWTRSTYNKSD